MSVSASIQGTMGLPVTTNRTQTVAETGANAGTGYEQNRYTPQQLMAQQSVLGNMNGVLSGQSQISPSLGLPQAVYDAHMLNFNKYVAPQLAAQHGAGSPAIPSAISQELLQLSALSGQNMSSNYNALNRNMIDAAWRPGGADTGQQNQNSMNRLTQESETGVDYGGVLQAIMGGLNTVLPPAQTFQSGTTRTT